MTDLTRVSRRVRLLLALAVAGSVAALLSACTVPPATEPAPTPTPTVTRPAAPAGQLPEALQTRLRATLDQTMSQYHVPGAAVGVWIPGQGSWTTAAGLADVAHHSPATTEMAWPLRSVTKSYTVTLILQLVDEGKISLDDPIDKYVSGVTNGDKITLRELANMSSGNADYTNQAFITEFTKDPTRIFTLDELNSFVLGQPAQFTPGTKRVYTNANTNLLGAVVEKATHESFADALQEQILQPLRMHGTRYITDVSTWTEPHPIGYVQDNGKPEAQPDNLSIFGPAGSMISTLEDGRVWGDVLGSGAMLKPATQAERQQGAPLDSGPPYDRYALGIGETDGWWGHNGEGLGFTAAIFHQPKSGATVVVYMNVSNVESKAHPADQLFRRIARILQDS